MFALSLYGVADEPAAGYTLVNHAVQIFPVMAVGFLSVLITGARLDWNPAQSRQLKEQRGA